jgi:hypothetical protein
MLEIPTCSELAESPKLQLTQTREQKGRIISLLLGSDAPAAFVRSCLVKEKNAELGVAGLYAHYQEWCRLNHLRPFASRALTAMAKEEMKIGLGLKLRHDLDSGNGKAKRGGANVGMTRGLFATMLEKVDTTEATGLNRLRLRSTRPVQFSSVPLRRCLKAGFLNRPSGRTAQFNSALTEC